MTGQDFQDKLDSIVRDLQTNGKGQTVNILFRGAGNAPQILPLSSDANGVVNAGQLAAIQAFINPLKVIATDYTNARVPVDAALEAFKTAQEPHQALMDAATAARKALTDALDADAAYQTAKTALDTARLDPDYVGFSADYRDGNVSENYAELSSAKGKYVV